ncbi:hypothetical protein OEA41_000120 [Lepraria neglecta]|uniref:Mercuric reductase n=1 Tax=Lepraria neglecta TaxID=209136 RepID=A0AAE0DR70_9LECA|nr:hypothetical protein OEA41_000120 [Lepraria neglecta]
MVASAKIAYYAKRQAEYGVKEAGEVTVDMATVRKRKRDIVDSFRGGSEGRLKKAENVTVVRGKARFVGMKEVEVQSTKGETERLKAEWVFVNVGCRPAPLAIPGADTVDILDSTSIMELDVVPEHLVVIGGGYVGLEFAQMFRRFGSKVTIVQRGGQLLGREDEDIAEEVRKVLEEDDVDVMLNSRAEKAEKIDDGKAKLVVKTENGEDEVLCSHILAAAGRVPNTNDLGLEKTGVELGKDGFVKVNEKLQTNVDGIFVMGDVKGGPAFTHISYDDFRILKGNILDNRTLTTTARLVPYTVFIDPQLGRIGHTEASAEAQGLKYRVAKMPMARVARALEMDESRGMMKVLVEEEGKGDQILGCAILGIDGGEVMSMIQIAVMGGVKWQALRDGVFAHPLLAESLNNLFGSLEG